MFHQILCVNKLFVCELGYLLFCFSAVEVRENVGGGEGRRGAGCPDTPFPSSSVFEPSMLHSMASGIQIAIKGLSVSSWCSIDLQRESNPDYEVQ